jgi:hypothetical protein
MADELQVFIRAQQEPREVFGRRVDQLLSRVAALEPPRLTLHLALQPPRLSVVPFSRRPAALLSLGPCCDRVAEVLSALDGLGRLEPYRVERSLPLSLPRAWPLGDPTPGVGLLTLLRRRRGLDDARFMHKWFGEHTPMSLALHPLWGYERNRVLGALAPAVPLWDGIVEEHFAQPSDLLDPRRFFGGTLAMPLNMVRVWRHVRSFLDLASLETFLVQERRLIEPS